MLKPGPLYIFQESYMADLIIARVGFPQIVDVDTELQELVVEIDGVSQDPQVFGKDVTSTAVKGPQGSSCKLTLTHLDDATPPNRSAPRVREFVFQDIVPPAQPGELEVTIEGEE